MTGRDHAPVGDAAGAIDEQVCDAAAENVAPIRAGDTARSSRPADLTITAKGLAAEASGGIMAPCVEVQQTRHGIWL